MSLLTLLGALIVIGLAFWVVRTITAAFAIPAPIVALVHVVMVVVVVLWLLQAFGLLVGGPVFRLR